MCGFDEKLKYFARLIGEFPLSFHLCGEPMPPVVIVATLFLIAVLLFTDI